MKETESLPIIRVVTSRTNGDCVIVALAMYLGETYEDVLAVAAGVIGPLVHHEGMWTKQLMKTADLLGAPLRRNKKFDLETSSGILDLVQRKGPAHAHVNVLREGLIIDFDGTVWDAEVYLLNSGYKPTHLYTRR